MSGCVVRRWEATVARDDLDGWVATYRDRVLDKVKSEDGFQSVAFHSEHEGDPCKVTVLMKWRDMEAVKRFAGDDPAKAVIPDFMQPYFIDADARATFHDEILLEASA